ncbi:hypothetical protein [Mucilaginibacter myungsuensis]|uniref:SPW repeat-containing protein n=1 Tax=Mucilaginibacter myungsuensis TaxID=649104 RepID=A0A929PYJ2_9SPHI|nr:hypothetical protein [Mucilaginibacter myungsuensis]MBE9663500.1 hypothetical protein [Mucilaginibacter myungsuensis]MDN3600238.1 hypothetical protein [Mucilaginibacter myungsuensis]
MKFISPKLHGIIDYLVVIFLLASPTIFGMTGMLSTGTYALGVVHLILTLLTDFSGGVVKLIPLALHGLIELVVGIALVVIAFTLLKGDAVGELFYTAFGAAVLVVFFTTDYKGASKV